MRKCICVLDASLSAERLKEVRGGYTHPSQSHRVSFPVIKFKGNVKAGDVISAVFYRDKRWEWKNHPAPPDWAYRETVRVFPVEAENPKYRLIGRYLSPQPAKVWLGELNDSGHEALLWSFGSSEADEVFIIAAVQM
jgi:hypothetical protein